MGSPGQAPVPGPEPAFGREQPPEGDGPALPPIRRGRGREQLIGHSREIDVGAERGVAGGEEVAGEAQIRTGKGLMEHGVEVALRSALAHLVGKQSGHRRPEERAAAARIERELRRQSEDVLDDVDVDEWVTRLHGG
jgi:hypothetical protein